MNEHTKEPLTFQQARATGARRPCGNADIRDQTHAHHSQGSIFLQNTVSFHFFPHFIFFRLPHLHQKSFFLFFFFLPLQGACGGGELLICKSSDL